VRNGHIKNVRLEQLNAGRGNVRKEMADNVVLVGPGFAQGAREVLVPQDPRDGKGRGGVSPQVVVEAVEQVHAVYNNRR